MYLQGGCVQSAIRYGHRLSGTVKRVLLQSESILSIHRQGLHTRGPVRAVQAVAPLVLYISTR